MQYPSLMCACMQGHAEALRYRVLLALMPREEGEAKPTAEELWAVKNRPGFSQEELDSRIESALARKRTVQRKEMKALGKEGEHLRALDHAASCALC